MPKLGPVTPGPAPVDPFKGGTPAPIGVVSVNQVSAVQPAAPKLGAVPNKGTKVFSVQPEAQVPIGVVRPAVAPPPPPPAGPAPLGAITDETPVYPPVAPPVKPQLGTIVDQSITPPQPVDDSIEPAPPITSQPVVVDPLAPKE